MASHQTFFYEDIDFDTIEADQVRNSEPLFYLLTAASFIETGSDHYTRNLIEFFADDAETRNWLYTVWEPEELRHGRMLKQYVSRVWPAFDWDISFRKFMAEYSDLCRVEALEPTHGLELAARCVVEMGTSTYYEAIYRMTEEPVLKQLTGLIRRDEIGHYKYFYRRFREYNADEAISRLKVISTLGRRLLEIHNSDADCALWSIFSTLNPDQKRDEHGFKAVTAAITRQLRETYPMNRAIKMLLRPLDLPPSANHVLHPVARIAQNIIF
jgi:hypothetical protein